MTDVDILEIIEVQRKLQSNLAVMLDNGLDEKKNIENLKFYIKKADFEFIPAFPYHTSEKTLEKISKLCDPVMVGIGGIVPVLRAPANLEEFKTLTPQFFRDYISPNSLSHLTFE